MSVRGWLAGLLVLAYGAACYGAFWDRGLALLSFTGVTLIAAWFIGRSMIPQILVALAIGIVVLVLSILVPPLGLILTIAGIIAWIIPALLSLRAFARRLPYLITSGAAYAYLWFVPAQFTADIGSGAGDPGHWLVTAGIAAGGVTLLAIIAQAGRLASARRSDVVFYTVGYGWYVLFFSLAIIFGASSGGGRKRLPPDLSPLDPGPPASSSSRARRSAIRRGQVGVQDHGGDH